MREIPMYFVQTYAEESLKNLLVTNQTYIGSHLYIIKVLVHAKTWDLINYNNSELSVFDSSLLTSVIIRIVFSGLSFFA